MIMNLRFQIAIVALAVTINQSLAPSLIASQPAEAIVKCEDEKGNSLPG